MKSEAQLAVPDGDLFPPPKQQLWPNRDGLEKWLLTLPEWPDPARLALARSVADQIDAYHLGPVLLRAVERGEADPELSRIGAALIEQGFGRFAGPLPAVLAKEFREILADIERSVADEEVLEDDPLASWAKMGHETTA